MDKLKIAFIRKFHEVEPLGLMYLTAKAKELGHKVEFIEFDDENNQYCMADFATRIIRYGPDIIGYSIMTGSQNMYLELDRKIRSLSSYYPHFNPYSIFGGAHPTFFPEMLNGRKAEYALFKGEADESFSDFLKTYNGDALPNYKIDGKLPLNIDYLPDREAFYKDPRHRDNPIKNVMTSRGCPYNCSYCHNHVLRDMYKGQKLVRYRSVESVIKECQELKKYPTKIIFFQDDEFITNKKRFYKLMLEYKNKVDIPFHCQIRIEQLDENISRTLKMCGCTGVTFAIESGNELIRKTILNRKITNDKILKGVKLLKDEGIMFRAENMLGIPTESLNQVFETVELNRKCKPTIGWASLFQPFPKTKLGKQCIKMGLFDGDLNSIKSTFFEDTTIIKDKLLHRRIVNLQRLFGLFVAYNIPRYMMKFFISLPFGKLYKLFSNYWKQNHYDKLYEGI